MDHQRLSVILLVITASSVAVFEYGDLLPYTGVVVGYGGSRPFSFIGQGIIGDIYFWPTSPTCSIYQNTGPPPRYWSNITGIVYRHGANLTIPISWKSVNCGIEGQFTINLYPPGVYHFTVSTCESTNSILGCYPLPTNVNVPPLTMARLNLFIRTGIE